MNFALVFVGVALWAATYLKRRNAAVIWLGDGLYRFVLNLMHPPTRRRAGSLT